MIKRKNLKLSEALQKVRYWFSYQNKKNNFKISWDSTFKHVLEIEISGLDPDLEK